MSIVLKKLVDSNDFVNVHCLPLINLKTRYVVITRRHSVDVYAIELDDTIKLRKSFPIWDIVLDSESFDPQGVEGQWLILTTASDRLLLIGFKSSTEAFVIHETDLKTIAPSLSIRKGTLIVSKTYFSFYTDEGVLCLFTFHKIKKRPPNFKDAINLKLKKKPKLLDDPFLIALTRIDKGNSRSPMQIIKIRNLDKIKDKNIHTISVIYRDDLYNYFITHFNVDSKGQLDQHLPLKLPEPLSPILLPFLNNFGYLSFGRSGIYLTNSPIVSTFEVDESITQGKGTTIEVHEIDGEISYAKKRILNHDGLIVAATVINESSDENIQIVLFLSENGELFATTLRRDIITDISGETEGFRITSWTLIKFDGILFPAEKITQLDGDLYLISSSTNGSAIVRINIQNTSYELIQEFTSSPPILDFNISGTLIPKLQIMGGSSITSGFIRTKFDSYPSRLHNVHTFDFNSPIIGLWKFGQIFIFNTFEGLHILEKLNNFKTNKAFEKTLEDIDGSILTLKISKHFTIVTEKGIYQDGVKINDLHIEAAVIIDDDSIIYQSQGSLKHKSTSIEHKDEIMSLAAEYINNKLHILAGNWDGSAVLYQDGKKKLLKKSNLAINSVLIKKLPNGVLYIIGDGQGTISFWNNDLDLVEYDMGDTPVSIVETSDNTSIVAYNAENIVKFKIDFNGNVVSKGYLALETPHAAYFDSDSSSLFVANGRNLSLLEIDDQIEAANNTTHLPRVIRKAVKFKNYLHLSVFATIHETYNEITDAKVIHSQLEVINNNTFETKSIYKLEPGVEITDVVNTKYRKELIDSHEEEKITLGFENVLGQCFVVSCVSKVLDEVISPLLLFSVDEDGVIKLQCSAPKTNNSFYALANHANRLVVGAGDFIGAYKIEYSVVDSKFSLIKVSDLYKPRYFASTIKSLGPDVIFGDVINGPVLLSLKVIDQTSKSQITFKFEEANWQVAERHHFLTALQTFDRYVITSDSLENIRVYDISNESFDLLSGFNIADKINIIKAIDTSRSTHFKAKALSEVDGDNGNSQIKPLFLLGTVFSGIYIIGIVSDSDLQNSLTGEETSILSELNNKQGSNPIISGPLLCDSDEGKLAEIYLNYRSSKSILKSDTGHEPQNFIDGDLIQNHGKESHKEIITNFASSV